MNSLILLSLAAFFYAIKELASHGKLSDNNYSFWGCYSYVRKYKTWPLTGAVSYEWAPKNWYYRLIRVKYKERWPTSTWLTVAFTDCYHLCQFIFLKLFILSIITYREVYSWYGDGLILLGAWYLVWNITYQLFQRKK